MAAIILNGKNIALLPGLNLNINQDFAVVEHSLETKHASGYTLDAWCCEEPLNREQTVENIRSGSL